MRVVIFIRKAFERILVVPVFYLEYTAIHKGSTQKVVVRAARLSRGRF